MNDMIESGMPPMGSASPMPIPAAGLNAGAVTIEVARAVAETRGKIQVAKSFPRDVNAAHRELMDACKLKSLADKAFYSVPRGGGKVTGPSVRLAEEIARCWGNIDYGHRELSRTEGKSEVEVYAWDMQTNTFSRRQLTVLHVMDTKDGPRKLRDQKDVDDKISNVASKQLRGRILAVLPKWLVNDAEEACRKTLAGGSDEPIAARVRRMLEAFSGYGVTQAMVEERLEHPLANATTDDLVDLVGVFNALREGAKVADYFNLEAGRPVVESGAAAVVASLPPAPAPAPVVAAAPPAQAAAVTTRRRASAPASPPPTTEAPPPAEAPADDAPTVGDPPPADVLPAEGGASGSFF